MKHAINLLFTSLMTLGCGTSAAAVEDGGVPPDADPADSAPADGLSFSPDGALDSTSEGCSDRLKSIFVVTAKAPQTIYSFDPDKLVFTRVLDLACPDTGSWTVQSMAVDRHYHAWVSWKGARLDRVDLASGACTPDIAKHPIGSATVNGRLGMAFTSDAPGTTAESLYFIDPSTQLYVLGNSKPIGRFYIFKEHEGTEFSGVELSGSGTGRLFNMIMNWSLPFPDGTKPDPTNVKGPTVHIGEVSKTNGTAIANDEVLGIPAFALKPGSFAFAQWGGLLWTFLAPDYGPTKVYSYDPVTKVVALKKTDGPDGVVGAGVSTCAPSAPIR